MEGPHSSPTWLLHTLSAHCLYCFPILVSQVGTQDRKSVVSQPALHMTGTDWQGQVGGGNSSATWDTKGITATCHGEEMEIEMEPVAPPITLWGTEEVEKGNKGKGRGSPASRKTRQASPLEW